MPPSTRKPTVLTTNNTLDKESSSTQAEALYRRALAGYESALGANHLVTLQVVNNLAILLMNQNRREEAEELYRRALLGYELR